MTVRPALRSGVRRSSARVVNYGARCSRSNFDVSNAHAGADGVEALLAIRLARGDLRPEVDFVVALKYIGGHLDAVDDEHLRKAFRAERFEGLGCGFLADGELDAELFGRFPSDLFIANSHGRDVGSVEEMRSYPADVWFQSFDCDGLRHGL